MSYHRKVRQYRLTSPEEIRPGVCYLCRQFFFNLYGMRGSAEVCSDCLGDVMREGRPAADYDENGSTPDHPFHPTEKEVRLDLFG